MQYRQTSGQQPYGYQPTFQPTRNPLRQALVLGGILLVVIIVILVGVQLLSGGGSSAQSQLSQVLSREQQVLSLIDTYGENVRSQEVNNEIASIKALTQSNVRTLTSNGIQASQAADQQLTNSQIEQQISNATSSSSFDSVFLNALKDQLGNNTVLLQSALSETTNAQFKAKLETIIVNEQSLVN